MRLSRFTHKSGAVDHPGSRVEFPFPVCLGCGAAYHGAAMHSNHWLGWPLTRSTPLYPAKTTPSLQQFDGLEHMSRHIAWVQQVMS